MDKLSEPQRSDIKKMSMVRLTLKLVAAGMPEEEIEKLDRQGMMEAWAKIVAEGKDKLPVVKAMPAAAGYDPDLEKERLAFERMKFEAEMKERQRREEVEQRRWEAEQRRAEEEKVEKQRREAEEKVEKQRRVDAEQRRAEEEIVERQRRYDEEKVE